MAFTTLKKLSAQAAASASGTWGAGGTTGVDLNTGVIGPLDTIVAGISTFSVSSSNVSLSFTAGGGGDISNCMLRFTGTLLASIVVSPAAGDATTYFNGFYFFENLTSGSFTITLTTGTGSVVLPQGRRGCLFIDGTNAPRITAIAGSATADPIPAGSVMPFYQNAAPAGWTIVSSQNNKALRVVSSAGGVAGGTTAFTSVFTSRTPAGTNSTGTASVTLPGDASYASTTFAVGALAVNNNNNGNLSMNGRTLSGTTSAPTFVGTAMDFAVQYIDLILATRD